MNTVRLGIAVLALTILPIHSFAWSDGKPDSWGMQLTNIDPKVIASSSDDLVVIDYSRDGTDENAFRADEVDAMKKNGKKVIAYLSIGKAEMWRFYWNSQWEARHEENCRKLTFDSKKRKWEWKVVCPEGNVGLAGEKNPDWDGVTYAKYWESDWLNKAIRPYLKRIGDAHFDGVYLDNIDAYEYWGMQNGAKAQYAREMEKLVGVISSLMKQKMGNDFLVIPEGGLSILEDSKNSAWNKRYLNAIDGISVRTLFSGISKKETQHRIDLLKKYYFGKNPILVLDFVTNDQATILRNTSEAFEKDVGLKFIIHAADQDGLLDELSSRKI